MAYNPLPKLIVILGPTSCGKTKLAVKLAKIFNGEIVSADSRQIYKGMDIGTGKDLGEYIIKKSKKQEIKKTRNQKNTAKTSFRTEKSIPYHLIDIVSPKSQFTLADYQKLAYRAINDIIERSKVPFLVGGTGLYLQAIIDGYNLSEAKPDEKLRKQLNKKTIKQLQVLAKKYGITLNESDFQNKRRLIRVIEKARTRNQEIKKARNQEIKKVNPKYNCLILGIKYPKKIIDKRIDKRLMHRLEKEGLVDEVKRLHAQGVSWKKLNDFGLEYRYVAKYLKSELAYDEMLKQLAIASHQFAKRQMTWFSAHGGSASGGKRDSRIKWIKNSAEAKKLTNNFLK